MRKYLFPYVFRPIFRGFLWGLDKLYQATRKRIEPKYPYDESTSTITLPKNIEKEIYWMAVQEGKPKAVKNVTELTGATLRISKNYVDYILIAKRTRLRSEGTKTREEDP